MCATADGGRTVAGDLAHSLVSRPTKSKCAEHLSVRLVRRIMVARFGATVRVSCGGAHAHPCQRKRSLLSRSAAVSRRPCMLTWASNRPSNSGGLRQFRDRSIGVGELELLSTRSDASRRHEAASACFADPSASPDRRFEAEADATDSLFDLQSFAARRQNVHLHASSKIRSARPATGSIRCSQLSKSALRRISQEREHAAQIAGFDEQADINASALGRKTYSLSWPRSRK